MAFSKRELERMVGSPLAIDASGMARRVARPPELERKPMAPPGLITLPRPKVQSRGSWRPWKEQDEQREIMKLYRGLGFHVWQLSQPQRVLASPGVPDVLARHAGRQLLVWTEVKNPIDPAPWEPAQQDFCACCIPGLEHYVLGSEGNARAFLVRQGFDIPLLP